MKVLKTQYELVRKMRQALFAHCDTLTPDQLVTSLEAFGGRSVRDLLAHIAQVYIFWLGHYTGFCEIPLESFTSFQSMDDIRSLYAEADDVAKTFFECVVSPTDPTFHKPVPGRDIKLTARPLELATHVMTHEFHHKGQILSMTRLLGCIPPDTDIIRF